jgi:excisionase family DNA binding protein
MAHLPHIHNKLNQKRLIRPAVAFDLLDIGHTKGYGMVKSGLLPTVRLGGSIRIPIAALEAWIEQNTRAASRLEAR